MARCEGNVHNRSGQALGSNDVGLEARQQLVTLGVGAAAVVLTNHSGQVEGTCGNGHAVNVGIGIDAQGEGVRTIGDGQVHAATLGGPVLGINQFNTLQGDQTGLVRLGISNKLGQRDDFTQQLGAIVHDHEGADAAHLGQAAEAGQGTNDFNAVAQGDQAVTGNAAVIDGDGAGLGLNGGGSVVAQLVGAGDDTANLDLLAIVDGLAVLIIDAQIGQIAALGLGGSGDNVGQHARKELVACEIAVGVIIVVLSDNGQQIKLALRNGGTIDVGAAVDEDVEDIRAISHLNGGAGGPGRLCTGQAQAVHLHKVRLKILATSDQLGKGDLGRGDRVATGLNRQLEADHLGQAVVEAKGTNNGNLVANDSTIQIAIGTDAASSITQIGGATAAKLTGTGHQSTNRVALTLIQRGAVNIIHANNTDVVANNTVGHSVGSHEHLSPLTIRSSSATT